VASHGKITNLNDDKIRLDPGWRNYGLGLLVVGLLAILGAIGYATVAEQGARHFYFSYLHSFIFFLSITLGSLFFVLVQHLTRAGWSVTIRRVAEIIAMNAALMAVLFLPIVFSVYQNKGELYPWAQKVSSSYASHDHAHDTAAKPAEGAAAAPAAEKAFVPYGVEQSYAESVAYFVKKKPILTNTNFYIAAIIFFGSWIIIAGYYYRKSKQQDESGDEKLTHQMQWWAPMATFVFALTLTSAAWFFIMSISPVWYSTMFGVYYFAGCMGATFAFLILAFKFLTSRNYVQHITNEHFQDLGKFLFGFTVFWAYIAYSQYMLIWYANIPEETFWFRLRGATTAQADFNNWAYIAILLVLCRFALPFLGLLSKHVKRNSYGIVFWAVWILVFHWIDLYWVVMPELFGKIPFGLMEILLFVGIGGMWLGNTILIATRNNLAPVKDPRLPEALAFENM